LDKIRKRLLVGLLVLLVLVGVSPTYSFATTNIDDYIIFDGVKYYPGEEITSKRTRNSKTFFAGGNRLAWEGTIGSIHYKDNPDDVGEPWKDIDSNIVVSPKADWDWEVVKGGWHLLIKNDTTVAVGKDGNWIGFRYGGIGYIDWATKERVILQTRQLVTPVIEGNKITWYGIFNGVDLEYIYDNDRFKENLIFSQAARDWLTANPPSSYGLDNATTYFGGYLEFDWQGSYPAEDKWGNTISWENANEFIDKEVFFRHPIKNKIVTALPIGWVSHDAVEEENWVKIRQRFWKEGTKYYLLFGSKVSELSQMPAGTLIFDPTIDEQVGASSDDATRRLVPSYFGLTAYNNAGDYSSTSYDYASGARFTTVDIPQGVTIDVAYLELKAETLYGSIPTTVIEGEDTDNAATFSTEANYDGRARTTANVNWTPAAWVTDTWYQSSSIVSVVQEIVNRAGWAANNAMAFFWRDAAGWGGVPKLLTACSYDWGAANAPKLHIEYTVGLAVTTSVATSVEETTATVNGEVTAIGDTSITERGFVWDTVTRSDPGNVAPSASAYANNWTEVGSWGIGTFNHGITALTKGELYYVRAAAKNNLGFWGYGSEITFLTKPDAPSGLVATAGDSQVSLSWTKGTGASNTIIRGKIGGYPASYNTDVDVYSGTGSSTVHSGLTNGDHWYYRAWSYATEGGKTQYSDLYVQADATPVGTPSVTTNSATNIGFTTATLNGAVTAVGDTSITDRGFVWGTTSYTDPGNIAPASTSYTSNWTETGTFGVGSFSHTATSLTTGQTYYFRAAAKNSYGWSYGGELSFQTVGLRLWFQPNTMINPANVPDRSGWGNTGTINWGTNPGGFEITIEGLKPFGSYVAPEQEGAPEIILLPAELEMFETEGVDLSHLPVYGLVHQYSESLGWSDQVGYGVLMIMTAIAFGFGAMVATGSALGFAIGFGIMAAAAGGTGALPWWIAIISVLFAIFAAYSWRHT